MNPVTTTREYGIVYPDGEEEWLGMQPYGDPTDYSDPVARQARQEQFDREVERTHVQLDVPQPLRWRYRDHTSSVTEAHDLDEDAPENRGSEPTA